MSTLIRCFTTTETISIVSFSCMTFTLYDTSVMASVLKAITVSGFNYGQNYIRTNHRQFLYIYDRLVRERQFTVLPGVGTADTSALRTRYFAYDAFGYCVIDSIDRSTIFDYDVQGRYISRHYSTWNLFEYEYFPDGKVKTIVYSEPDSGITGTKTPIPLDTRQVFRDIPAGSHPGLITPIG